MPGIITNYGECRYEVKSDFVHIYGLYVKPEFRRSGNAKRLLEMIIRQIRRIGYDGEIQIVSKPNKECRVPKERLDKLYKSLGLVVFDYYG